MATNNYFGFTHGGTQYGSAATGYNQAYAAAATYGTPQTYQAAPNQGTYANTGAPAPTYDYGYGRPAQAYDTSKTYYQQAPGQPAGYTAPAYDGTAAAKVAGYPTATAAYAAQPVRPANIQPQPQQPAKVSQYNPNQTYIQPNYSQSVTTVNSNTVPKAGAAPNPTTTYSNYDAALYSAATMYVAQQSNKAGTGTGQTVAPGQPGNWQYKKAATTANAAGTQQVVAQQGVATGQPGAQAPQHHTHHPHHHAVSHHHAMVNNGGAVIATPGGAGAAIGPPVTGGGGGNKSRYKQQAKPQQLHYCEVCKISCAGPQTYREHLEGQKHKKREASLKLVSTATSGSRSNNMHCELCDVTCTGYDAFAAHVRGSKHTKVVKLHQKLGKPIPDTDPLVVKRMQKVNFVPEQKATMSGCVSSSAASEAVAETVVQPAPGQTPATTTATAVSIQSVAPAAAVDEEMMSMEIMNDVKPVGSEYIEEVKEDESGKIISFNCKLCECKFNDPNAKEMHMKGRRHRLQYKKKVQPDLVVDLKPSPRRQKLAEAKAQRAAKQEEYFARRRSGANHEMEIMNSLQEHHLDECSERPRVWPEQRRRFDDECEYMGWSLPRIYIKGPHQGSIPPHCVMHGGPSPDFIRHASATSFYPMMLQDRRPESTDDRHVVARHAEIYPKEEELQVIQRIVSHTERALKFVSDALTDPAPTNPITMTSTPESAKTEVSGGESGAAKATRGKEDGRDNQMFSFHNRDADGRVRVLKGVMRVGLLAKGLLLQGDDVVELVVLCAEKPTQSLLTRVATELPLQLGNLSEEHMYKVSVAPEDGAVLVSDGQITVKVSLTSPLLREQDAKTAAIATAAAVATSATGAGIAASAVTAELTVGQQPVDAKSGVGDNNVGSGGNANDEVVSGGGGPAAAAEDDLLPREPCLAALAALRHAKWFQARATGLQSCVMIMRVIRDLCQRVPTWTPICQWAMELFIEKVLSSAGGPLTPGDCLRRVMEAVATGTFINGVPLLDPCEKEVRDALGGLSKQQREDITVSGQHFLRMIAFRQIHKVLAMEPLPLPKFPVRPLLAAWRQNNNRKRRRSGAEDTDGMDPNDSSKVLKVDSSDGQKQCDDSVKVASESTVGVDK